MIQFLRNPRKRARVVWRVWVDGDSKEGAWLEVETRNKRFALREAKSWLKSGWHVEVNFTKMVTA